MMTPIFNIDYNAELHSSLFTLKSTAQLVKFQFFEFWGGGVAYSAALPCGIYYLVFATERHCGHGPV